MERRERERRREKQRRQQEVRLEVLVLSSLILASILVISLAIHCAKVLPDKFKYGTPVIEQATIDELEKSDPTYLADVKEQLADIIEEKTGERPEKISFIVAGGNYVTCCYDVTIYYKLPSRTWHYQKLSWNDDSISDELDEQLAMIYCGEYWDDYCY